MDKRARLLEGLRYLGRKGTNQMISRSSADSDGGLHFVSTPQAAANDGNGSDFSEGESESDDELERHLPLLLPEELADLGADALQLGHHEAALRYLLLAQLRFCEGLAKRLALRDSVQMSGDETFLQWSIAHLLSAAVHKGAFIDRKTMSEMFESIVQSAAASGEVESCAEQNPAKSYRLDATFRESQ